MCSPLDKKICKAPDTRMSGALHGNWYSVDGRDYNINSVKSKKGKRTNRKGRKEKQKGLLD
jgi:hypothetical protein